MGVGVGALLCANISHGKKTNKGDVRPKRGRMAPDSTHVTIDTVPTIAYIFVDLHVHLKEYRSYYASGETLFYLTCHVNLHK